MSTVVEMQSIGRPRQYVSAARLYAMFPLLRFSYERGAYVLRFVGESRGPVLRKDRRRRPAGVPGPDRRGGRGGPVASPHGPWAASGGSRRPRLPRRSDRDSAADTAATRHARRRRPAAAGGKRG